MRLPVLLVGALLCASTSHSLIYYNLDDGSGNTSAPSAPGWYNVGMLNGATGVYLGEFGGNHWVITANHVGVGSINLNGTVYNPVSGSGVTLRNGDDSLTDLLMFRLQGDPGLPNLQLLTQNPPLGAEVLMVGTGRTRSEDQAYWDINGVWTELASPTGAEAHGYHATPPHQKRWATNTVSSYETIQVAGRTIDVVSTRFDATPGNGQAVSGDSGGALFYYDGENWGLGGIMVAVNQFSGQPNHTAVIGNLTYSANIVAYQNEIQALIPEISHWGLLGAGTAGMIALFTRRRGH